MHRRKDSIQEHLSKEDVKQRIKQAIFQARSQATVTIAQAADLFGFSENQLRDWEERKLLTPERPQHETGAKGRRLYGIIEIVKLAIIRELKDANYSPSDIPSDIYQIWSALEDSDQTQSITSHTDEQVSLPEVSLHHKVVPIDRFIEDAHAQLFDRFFTSRVLYLALSLICEDIPDTVAGLILPRRKPPTSLQINAPEELQRLGECLVGWWGETRSFYAFLTQAPTFDYPSDYRIESLSSFKGAGQQQEDMNAWVIIQRKAKQLNINKDTMETIQRLLNLIYDNALNWWSLFGYGMRTWLDPSSNFSSTANPTDIILTGITNKVISLGGKRRSNQSLPLWRFCCVLLPQDAKALLPQQSLIVRAKSTGSPHRVGITAIAPHDLDVALSLRAFQGGHIVYRHEISDQDFTVGLREDEGNIHSALAVPIGGEDGMPVGVLYVASDEPNAFQKGDQRLLRLIVRIIEELLKDYTARQGINRRLTSLINDPGDVYVAFTSFRSETNFINDVESLFKDIQEQQLKQKVYVKGDNSSIEDDKQIETEQVLDEMVSFIAVDIDNQSKIANKYGDRLTRNLSRLVGLRIEGQLGTIFRRLENWKLYHIYGDRFYIMLKGVSMERALDEAEMLRQGLEGIYNVDAFDRPSRRDNLVEIPNVSVRLCVTSYTYLKLQEILHRYSPSTASSDVISIMMRSLDEGLKVGMLDNGNVIYYWNRNEHVFERWDPKNKD